MSKVLVQRNGITLVDKVNWPLGRVSKLTFRALAHRQPKLIRSDEGLKLKSVSFETQSRLSTRLIILITLLYSPTVAAPYFLQKFNIHFSLAAWLFLENLLLYFCQVHIIQRVARVLTNPKKIRSPICQTQWIRDSLFIFQFLNSSYRKYLQSHRSHRARGKEEIKTNETNCKRKKKSLRECMYECKFPISRPKLLLHFLTEFQRAD